MTKNRQILWPRGLLGLLLLFGIVLAGGLVASHKVWADDPYPIIDSVTPDSGDIAGGDTVIISGSRFTGSFECDGTGSGGITDVTFGGADADSSNVVCVDDSTLYVTVPPSTVAGPVDVVIHSENGGDSDPLVEGFTYTSRGLPFATFTNLKQSVADTQGGKLVTLHGFALNYGYTLSLGGTVCATVLREQDSITCYVTNANTITPILIKDRDGNTVWQE